METPGKEASEIGGLVSLTLCSWGFRLGCSLPIHVLSGGRRMCVFMGVCELLRPRLPTSDSRSEAPSVPALTFRMDRCPDGLPASVPS